MRGEGLKAVGSLGVVLLMCRSPEHPASRQERKLEPSGAVIIVSWWRSAYRKMFGLLPGPVARDCTPLLPVGGRAQQTKVDLF